MILILDDNNNDNTNNDSNDKNANSDNMNNMNDDDNDNNNIIILLHKSERGNSKAQMQPKTGSREQIPGRGKEYILGCLHFGKKKSRKFCFLEELILSKI